MNLTGDKTEAYDLTGVIDGTRFEKRPRGVRRCEQRVEITHLAGIVQIVAVAVAVRVVPDESAPRVCP
jgi:hypothetical protein